MLKQKTVSIILAILMLLSLLCGCQSAALDSSPTTGAPTIPTTVNPTTVPEPTPYDPLAVPPEVTEETLSSLYHRANIKQTTDNQHYFFGAFADSYAVLFRCETDPCEPCWETVNGLTFYYPDGHSILWINQITAVGDTAGHLWEMFNRQLITEEQLQEIYDNYYSAYPELLPLAQAARSFGPDDMEAISRALQLATEEDLSWKETNTAGQYRLVYYCTVEGKHVFRWIPHYKSALLEYQKIYVGTYRFAHPEFFQLYVYADEELLTLNEAYDRGLFADEHIKGIVRYHATSDI